MTAEHLKSINEFIPLHSMWDGFWIFDLDKDTLTVTCSFDRIYYRNFDIEIKGVSFFNIPAEWGDTNVRGDDLFRMADKEEFALQQPGFDTGNKHILAIDLFYYPIDKPAIKHTFYIVADSISAEKCLQGNAHPFVYYTDPYEKENFPCFKNRMLRQ